MNDLIILALLVDGPKHGYQIKREAGFVLGQGEMHNNLVYPLLRRFTEAGWVTKKARLGERGQTRHQYSLTAAGRKELIHRLGAYGEAEAASPQGFLTRVGMFAVLDPEVRQRILEERERHLQQREQRLAGLEQNVELGVYGGEVVRHLTEQIRAERAWIRRLRRLHPDAENRSGELTRRNA